MSECPKPDLIRQLGTGSISEQVAEALFDHLAQCESCQALYDEIISENDLPIDTGSLKTEQPADELNSISTLIRRAQELNEPVIELKPYPDKSVSLSQFKTALEKSQLFSDEELTEITNSDSFGSSEELANELTSKEKLTNFQARALLRGKWKGLVLGKFKVLRTLGKGGMGRVFRAVNREDGSDACIKVLHRPGRKSPRAMERFRNEAQMLLSLSHENIVMAHAFGEQQGIPFLAMEYVDADNLSVQVKTHGPIAEPHVIQIGIGVADAMSYAHQRGLIHRDIKPHNLLFSHVQNGSTIVKVLDLGLAKVDDVLTDSSIELAGSSSDGSDR